MQQDLKGDSICEAALCVAAWVLICQAQVANFEA